MNDSLLTADVAIVGGGPVGLAAAIGARLAGLTVVIIEQRDGEIDKACGEGLMPGALPLLARLGVHPHGHPIGGITYRQAARSITHRFSSGPGMGVRRLELSSALSARAAELGVIRITAKVDELTIDDSGVSIGTEVRGSWLLACDGLHSTVARLTGLALPAPKRRRRYGVRQHFRVAPWSDNVEVYYGRSAEIYVTPISADITGVAMLGGQGTDFVQTIAEIPELERRLRGAEPASSRRGAGPFHQRTRARTAGRVLLVGDASGYVDAITGEGLRVGFEQAAEAVRCIARNRPRDYERAWARSTRDFRILTKWLVSSATGPFRSSIVPLAVALPGVFGWVVERLAR